MINTPLISRGGYIRGGSHWCWGLAHLDLEAMVVLKLVIVTWWKKRLGWFWIELSCFFELQRFRLSHFFLELRLDLRIFFAWGGWEFLSSLRDKLAGNSANVPKHPKDPKKILKYHWSSSVGWLKSWQLLNWFGSFWKEEIQQLQILLFKKKQFYLGRDGFWLKLYNFSQDFWNLKQQGFYVTMWFVEGFIHPLYP